MTGPKPRVAILHYAAPPIVGGVEATIGTHARILIEHGYAAKIITGRGARFDPHVAVEIIPDADSQSSRVLEMNTELMKGQAGPKFEALAKDLKEALTAALADSDVLVAHNVLSLHKNLALTAAVKMIHESQALNLVAWCHDFAWIDPQYADQMHPEPPWDLLRQAWEGVQYVVVSETRKAELLALWKKAAAKVSVVPPGIDACEFLGLSAKAAKWIKELALSDAAPLLILPARLTRRKNIEQAIEIVAALREQGAAPKLLVTGPPGAHNPTNEAYLENLRALRHTRRLNDAVLFLHDRAPVDRQTLRDLYWLADGLLFPSASEGFGIPLLEAGLTRLPIFCADLPVFHESARAHAHYFSSDQSPNQIAQLIRDVLGADSAYQLKKRILNDFAWEKIFVQKIEPLIHKPAE